MKIGGRLKETIGVIAVLLGLVILQKGLWITGERMLSHDSIIWFGAFSYFADCLQRGILPLWNPYMNCGEIFFLNIHALHFWDPSTLFLVFAGKFLKLNTLAVYQYDLLLRYLFFIVGGYFFFRHIAKHKISAFIAFITLAFSSLCNSYLKQHAFILSFYLLPWILLFTFKYLEEKRSILLVWLALFWGIALSSYHAMYLISSVAVLLICLFVTKGLSLPKNLRSPDGRKYSGWALLVFLFLLFNLLPVFLTYTRDIVPTARMFEAPLAAHSFPPDFFNLFAPYSFIIHFFNWFYMSEAFLYIGLIPLFFAIVGLFYSRNKYRIGFAFTAVIIALLMLGPRFVVSSLFSGFFPFFKIIRNTHTFSTFFIFCLACFVCIGADVVAELAERSALGRYKRKFILIAIIIGGIVFLVNSYVLTSYEPMLRQFHARYDNPSSVVGQDFFLPPKEMFFGSYYNAFLFIVSIMCIFIIVGKAKINLRLKYFTIISLILVDLVIFNLRIYKFEVGEKADMSLWPKGDFSYNDHRIPIMWPRYPFYGFAPAMQRKFTAVSSEIPWVTTHFYEMKDFFEFANNEKIPIPVKSAFMGISAPKLKLVNGAVVLPAGRQAEKFGKLGGEAMNNAVFIEEDPPARFSGLEIPLEGVGRADSVSGVINVLKFDPNSLLLRVKPEKDGFLYYSDTFDRSWRGFIDGKETKIYRTNMAFKSVIVGKGDHIVRFVYDPRLYKAALLCYFTGILAAVAILVHSTIERRETRGKAR